MIGHSGGGEVCTIGRHHASLSETRSWVGCLHCWVDGRDRADDAESKVERYEEAIQRAFGPGKVSIENTSESDGRDIHHSSGANEDPLPKGRLVFLPVIQASL